MTTNRRVSTTLALAPAGPQESMTAAAPTTATLFHR
jgi:hypothetical protein